MHGNASVTTVCEGPVSGRGPVPRLAPSKEPVMKLSSKSRGRGLDLAHIVYNDCSFPDDGRGSLA